MRRLRLAGSGAGGRLRVSSVAPTIAIHSSNFAVVVTYDRSLASTASNASCISDGVWNAVVGSTCSARFNQLA